MKNNEEKIKMLDLQMTATALIIVAFIGIIIVNYNTKLTLEGKEPIFSNKTSENVLIFDRAFTLLLFFVYFYIDYKNRKIVLNENYTQKEERNANLQLFSSILTIISGIIVLYVTIDSGHPMIREENPEL